MCVCVGQAPPSYLHTPRPSLSSAHTHTYTHRLKSAMRNESIYIHFFLLNLVKTNNNKQTKRNKKKGKEKKRKQKRRKEKKRNENKRKEKRRKQEKRKEKRRKEKQTKSRARGGCTTGPICFLVRILCKILYLFMINVEEIHSVQYLHTSLCVVPVFVPVVCRPRVPRRPFVRFRPRVFSPVGGSQVVAVVSSVVVLVVVFSSVLCSTSRTQTHTQIRVRDISTNSFPQAAANGAFPCIVCMRSERQCFE